MPEQRLARAREGYEGYVYEPRTVWPATGIPERVLYAAFRAGIITDQPIDWLSRDMQWSNEERHARNAR